MIVQATIRDFIFAATIRDFIFAAWIHMTSKTFTISNKRWIPHTRKFKTANETSVQDLETGFKAYLEFSLLGIQGFVWIPVDSCGFLWIPTDSCHVSVSGVLFCGQYWCFVTRLVFTGHGWCLLVTADVYWSRLVFTSHGW